VRTALQTQVVCQARPSMTHVVQQAHITWVKAPLSQVAWLVANKKRVLSTSRLAILPVTTSPAIPDGSSKLGVRRHGVCVTLQQASSFQQRLQLCTAGGAHALTPHAAAVRYSKVQQPACKGQPVPCSPLSAASCCPCKEAGCQSAGRWEGGAGGRRQQVTQTRVMFDT
jgi:hypothetical protein